MILLEIKIPYGKIGAFGSLGRKILKQHVALKNFIIEGYEEKNKRRNNKSDKKYVN